MKIYQPKVLGCVLTCLIITLSLQAQLPVEVDAIIHSKSGGFKFPDNTLQLTAASNLIGEEVSDHRGLVTAFYSNLTNVSPNLGFKVLDLSFNAVHPIGFSNVSQLEIIHNMEFDWPDFYSWFILSIGGHDITVTYLDENNTVYMTHIFTGCLIKSIEPIIIPFTTNEFGHMVKMSHQFNKLAVIDEINDNCICWNFAANEGINCGCD